MRLGAYGVLAAIAVASPAMPVASQVARNRTSTVEMGNSSQVARLPYTAEFRIVSVGALADGITTKTVETTYVEAKDSQRRRMGRTTEISKSGNDVIAGNIYDPVGGTQTEWDTRQNRAIVAKWPPEAQRHGCWQSDVGDVRNNFGRAQPDDSNPGKPDDQFTGSPQDDGVPVTDPPKPVFEDLGFATIQGVEAHGVRWTWPNPDDAQVPENQKFVLAEHWIATGLGIWVRQLVEYPQKRNGTRTYSQDLVRLTLGEPDAEIFDPPAGFKILNEEMHQLPCAQFALHPKK
jgi:hypothetical protein